MERDFKDLTQAIVAERVKKIVVSECERYGIIDSDTVSETRDNYTFTVTHTRLKSSETMIRYNLIAFNNTEVIYQDGNAIDYDKRRTIEQCIAITKGYFAHHAKLLSSI